MIKPRTLALIQTVALIAAMTCAFTAGYYWPHKLSLTQYQQVYANGARSAYQEIALCTIEAAHDETCQIPCATDADCLAKNGMTDH